jgi:pimeloyl-ACP methyl ester carboxylesterase
VQIQNGDVTLNVETAGDESFPPLLLLHGITASHRSWSWLVPGLADRYRVLAPDFRGHGRSGRAPGDYAPQRYVDDAIAVLEQAAAAPAIVIGHSLGGVTAAALAQQRQDLVRALVLEDPPLGSMEEGSAAQGSSVLDSFRLMKEALPGVQALGMSADAVADTLAAMPTSSPGISMGEQLGRESIVGIAAGLLELDVTVLDPILDGTARTAFDPKRPIPVTTLLITADPARPDAVGVPVDVDPVVAVSPLVRHHTVRGAGHLIHDEIAHRGEFVEQVEAFLRSL